MMVEMRTRVLIILFASVATSDTSASQYYAFIHHSIGTSYQCLQRRRKFTSQLGTSSTQAKSFDDGKTSITYHRLPPKRRRSWEESYEGLLEYKDVNGHCNVPQSEKPLGTWVNTQRIEHARYLDGGGDSKKKTSMNAHRKQLLDAIGFVWDAMGHTWDTRYDELCEFRNENGHCVVPRSNGRLGAWVEKQRIQYKKYVAMNANECIIGDDPNCKTILTVDQVKKLNDIDFIWDVREKQFEQKLGQLRIFKDMNGNIDPRLMNGSLAVWVRKYEQQYLKYLDAISAGVSDSDTLKSILPENRRVALEAIGFSRSMFDELPRDRTVVNRRANWEERYKELEEYKAECGHCMVPKNHGPLGSWVRAQRHCYKDIMNDSAPFEDGGQLSPERIARLNKIDFVWDVYSYQWNQTYHELMQYRQERNHTNVPMSYGGLGLWVFNQRAHYNSYMKGNQSGMTPSRVELLLLIGFEFDLGQKILSAADERWQKRLHELKVYEWKWGTFKVKNSHNPSLYNWCQHQKARIKKSSLKKYREDALRDIGFIIDTEEQ